MDVPDVATQAVFASGLDKLTEDSGPGEYEAALVKLQATLGTLGASELQRELARLAATRLLADRGIPNAARLVTAAIATTNGKHHEETSRLQGASVAPKDPIPWPQPVNAAELLTVLSDTFSRFLVLPESGAHALALWTLHGHAHDAATVSPILAFCSPEKRCGKSTALYLLEALVPRPLRTANISTAATFRSIEKYRPTLLIDEADTFLAAREELRGVLNAGHVRGGTVIRTVGEDFEPRTFSTWSPKIIALIGDLPPTLRDRAIVVPMRRRAPDEKVERLRLDHLPALGEPLRRQAWRWAQDSLALLRPADPPMPEELHDRASDNWRALIAIADLAGPPWPALARRAALTLSGASHADEDSLPVLLLADARRVFDSKEAEDLSSEDLVGALVAMEERPWPEMRHGKPLSKRGLARLLDRFGVHPTQLWLAGGKARGYKRAAFADAWGRYLPSDAVGAVDLNNDDANAPTGNRYDADRLPNAESADEARSDRTLPLLPDEQGGGALPLGAGDAWEPES